MFQPSYVIQSVHVYAVIYLILLRHVLSCCQVKERKTKDTFIYLDSISSERPQLNEHLTNRDIIVNCFYSLLALETKSKQEKTHV